MLFDSIEISDLFFEITGFNKYKNKYGDLVDEVDDLVMYGSKVSWAMASSIRLVTIPKLDRACHCYCVTNNTKYSIAKRSGTNGYWGFNYHYGWNMLNYEMLSNIPKKILKMAD